MNVNITHVTNETMLVTWTSEDEVEKFTVVYSGTFKDMATQNETVLGEERSCNLSRLLSGETYALTVIGESGAAFAKSEERMQTTGKEKGPAESTVIYVKLCAICTVESTCHREGFLASPTMNLLLLI